MAMSSEEAAAKAIRKAERKAKRKAEKAARRTETESTTPAAGGPAEETAAVPPAAEETAKQAKLDSETYYEGAAALRLNPKEKDVFFNPTQRLQRDLSILALQQYAAARPLTLLDAMTGGGVRAIRYLGETSVSHVIANDIDVRAVTAVRENATLSGVTGDCFEVTQSPAVALMQSTRSRRIDAIDLDPCGCVAELLPSAVSCLLDGGLLLASCTDLGSMSGRFGEQSASRYGAQPLREAQKQAPELAIRMLLGSIARAAGAVGRTIEPLLSVAFADFFVRVIVIVRDACGDASLTAPMGLVHRCSGCACLSVQPLGGAQSVGRACRHCGGVDQVTGGPFYVGATADQTFIDGMLARLDGSGGHLPLVSPLGSLSVLRPLLRTLHAEAALPTALVSMPVPACCRLIGASTMPLEVLTRTLASSGVRFAVPHWDPCCIKLDSDSGVGATWDAIASWATTHPSVDTPDGGETRARLMARRTACVLDVDAEGSSLQQQKRRRIEAAKVASPAESKPGPTFVQPRLPEGEGTAGSSGGCKFSVTCGFPFARDARGDEATAGCVTVLRDGDAVHGTYESVHEAVRAAPAGALVLIGRGDYTESCAVVVDKPLTICAARGAKLGRHGRGSVLVVDVPEASGRPDSSEDVLVSGLVATVMASPPSQSAPAADDGESAGYAIVVRGGRATFTQCSVESDESGCVFISASATAELHGCHIRRSAGHGVLVSGRATARLSHCHVQSTWAAGIEARGRAVVRLHCCRVHHSQRSGVFASSFAQLHADRCNLFNNAYAAAECSAQAEATLDACRMHHGQRGAALALGRSTLTLTSCDMYKNAMASVSVRGSATATLRANRITDGRASGVHVCEAATCALEDNVICGNRLCGVEVEATRGTRDANGAGGATLVAKRNELSANGGGAWSVPTSASEFVTREQNIYVS